MSKCDCCSHLHKTCDGLHQNINPMCNRCVKLINKSCKGETCMVYTGCIYRELEEMKERRNK